MTTKIKVGIIGLGFVGSAIEKSFKLKKINTKGYDKFKESDSFIDCLDSNFLYLCLPTKFDYNKNEYDKSIIFDVCKDLSESKYNGLIIIKSTVEPKTTNNLANIFKNLYFLHNPEFLTASTAFKDFHNQTHIVLGNNNGTEEQLEDLVKFYQHYYPDSQISQCNSNESESMKIFCNNFYSIKIQFFNELYLLCKKNEFDYENIVALMLKNKWINPMHTKVPGPDGKLSYGGLCFPKDTNALLEFMKKSMTPHKLLENCIAERNEMRNDNTNTIEKKNED